MSDSHPPVCLGHGWPDADFDILPKCGRNLDQMIRGEPPKATVQHNAEIKGSFLIIENN